MAKLPEGARPVGDNVFMVPDDDFLILAVKKNEAGKPSASGKSMVIGSTRGNVNLDGINVGFNAYRRM